MLLLSRPKLLLYLRLKYFFNQFIKNRSPESEEIQKVIVIIIIMMLMQTDRVVLFM